MNIVDVDSSDEDDEQEDLDLEYVEDEVPAIRCINAKVWEFAFC
jgi:hypothetical protein